MPKISLKNTLTGKIEQFEPVDAREVLANPDGAYEAYEPAQEAIGQRLDAGVHGDGINVPQLQGADAEMQTGLSIEKYGREAVVKAEPGAVEVKATVRPSGTTQAAVQATADAATAIAKAAAANEAAARDAASQRSSADVRDALKVAGVKFDARLGRDKLVALEEGYRASGLSAQDWNALGEEGQTHHVKVPKDD